MTRYTAHIFDHYEKLIHIVEFNSPPGQSIEANARAAIDGNPPQASINLRGGSIQAAWRDAAVKDAMGHVVVTFPRYTEAQAGWKRRVIEGDSRPLNTTLTISNDGPVVICKNCQTPSVVDDFLYFKETP